MAENEEKVICPFIFEDAPNEIFDEAGNRFLALRKVQWLKSADETPDPEKGKLELRKWIINKDGEEQANKGFSFLTEEGPHELTKVMVNNGFGHTKDILGGIKKRDDFEEAVNTLYDKEEDSDDSEFFDMRAALLAEGDEDGDVTIVEF